MPDPDSPLRGPLPCPAPLRTPPGRPPRPILQRIMNVKFSFPANLQISAECQDLISGIFVANPTNRITIAEIRRHPWFLRNLPAELAVG